jgi:hypothetical protein
MRVIYTSKGMSKKFGVRVIYRKIRYMKQDAMSHSLFYLETAIHISGGTITHHQERK